ncbi:MAG: hypothetical protein N3A59_07825 [Thermodesulfovibrionales bacterium]|nr:hypothetical protein [Thermodesulfovibrionales bacterium]
MNYSRIGFYAGTIVGLIIFVTIWLLPIAVFGGFSGAKIQKLISGNSQGFLSVLIMGLIVILSGVIFTSFSSFIGWLGGNAYNSLKLKTTKDFQRQETLHWCPIGKLNINSYSTIISNAIKEAQTKGTLHWCPKA